MPSLSTPTRVRYLRFASYRADASFRLRCGAVSGSGDPLEHEQNRRAAGTDAAATQRRHMTAG
jgi:hypothetical protein